MKGGWGFGALARQGLALGPRFYVAAKGQKMALFINKMAIVKTGEYRKEW